MPFKRPLKAPWHSELIKSAGKTCRTKGQKSRKRRRVRTGSLDKKANDETGRKTGIKTMARFDISDIEMAAGGETRADTLCNLGLVYATGRGCKVDLIAAHKWLNIAAIRGSERAASLRADLARNMTKSELAEALRAARDWMTMH
jgi:TPR repeat protein